MTWLAHLLLIASFGVPLGMLALCATGWGRRRIPSLLVLAPLPGLLAALFAPAAPPLVIYADWLRFTLSLDTPAALLLGVAALLWSAAGAYAQAYQGGSPQALRFAAWWLLTLAGSLGVFLAGDLVSFYFFFALVSLSAYGLVVHDGTPRARRAGAVYILLAVMGEIFLLLAFALLSSAEPSASLAIRDVVASLPQSPWRDATIALLVLGFGLKAGLVPLHVWLPLAHPAAPMPASAVLSGAIIKAGIIGLIRFLPAEGGPGEALAVLGFFTAFYAVAVGITQQNPKTILAYSSVSQMGVVIAVLGLGIAAADPTAPLGAAFYASHHVLAKGALFLAVGVAYAFGQRLGWGVLALVGVIALGLGGLPLTGGALAKAAVKGPMSGAIAATLGSLSAAGTSLLMLHFLDRLRQVARAEPPGTASRGMVLPWLLLTVTAVLLPWLLMQPLGLGDPIDSLAPGALWAAAWPVLLGGALAVALRRWRRHLPALPEGDILPSAERAWARLAPPLSGMLLRTEQALRTWPNAGLSLLGLALAFAGVMWMATP